MNQLTSIAQSHHRNVDQQVTQIEELQATITAKDEVIAQRRNHHSPRGSDPRE
jgi:uncharacterized protein (DUF3084 family)